MGRFSAQLVAAAAACVLIAGGCSKREAPSALTILEELEAASAVKDPSGRIERLEIFLANHKEHPYRYLAYSRVLEAMVSELKDEAGAKRFLAGALAKETDPVSRGELLLAEFVRLVEKGQREAVAFADSLLATEQSPRLFLYMGYYLMDPKMNPALATKCFLTSADLSTARIARSHAITMAAACFDQMGEKEEAWRYLAMAEGNPEADEMRGRILWEEGKRAEAIDAYIRCAARMPGARKHTRLDSLFALVYPDAKDLDERIMAGRIGDEGQLSAGVFVDLEGMAYDLSKVRGRKVVLYALSPT